MPRRDIDLTRQCQPIRGGAVQVRTFADGYFGFPSGGERGRTIDRVVTVTLPAIDGETMHIVPTVEIEL